MKLPFLLPDYYTFSIFCISISKLLCTLHNQFPVRSKHVLWAFTFYCGATPSPNYFASVLSVSQVLWLHFAAGRLILALSPQNRTRSDLRRPEIPKNSWGGMPPDPPSGRASSDFGVRTNQRPCIGTPLCKFLNPPLHTHTHTHTHTHICTCMPHSPNAYKCTGEPLCGCINTHIHTTKPQS